MLNYMLGIQLMGAVSAPSFVNQALPSCDVLPGLLQKTAPRPSPHLLGSHPNFCFLVLHEELVTRRAYHTGLAETLTSRSDALCVLRLLPCLSLYVLAVLGMQTKAALPSSSGFLPFFPSLPSFFLFFFRAAPAAYGSSQARGRAVTA